MDGQKAPVTREQLDSSLASQEARIIERVTELIHDSETRLLKAFYTFAESTQQRMAHIEGNTTAVITRLSTLESRVTELEKRLNLPPAA